MHLHERLSIEQSGISDETHLNDDNIENERMDKIRLQATLNLVGCR